MPYVRHIFFIWLGITLLIELFGPVKSRIMGAPASESMKAIEDTMSLLTYTAAPVAALVIAVVLYSIFGWRQAKGAGCVRWKPNRVCETLLCFASATSK